MTQRDTVGYCAERGEKEREMWILGCQKRARKSRTEKVTLAFNKKVTLTVA